MLRNKKGQAITFGSAPTLIVLFGLTVLIAAAMAVGVQSFQDSQAVNSSAANISIQGLVGLQNFSIQLPTVGTILGVALIIVVIVGAFGFFIASGRRGPGL